MKYSTLVCALTSALTFSLVSHSLSAQAQVREPSSSDSAVAVTEAPVSATANLVFNLQALQQEVSQLRGLVEQQAYELKRLKQQRLDDYLDLDKRLSELSKQSLSGASVAVVESQTSVGDSTAGVGTDLSGTTNLENLTSENGDKLYDSAIDNLLNKQAYEESQKQFSEYIATYPQGKFTPNVYYWQGQILLSQAKKDSALEVFKKLITEYPDHPKSPDAKFKLAKIYFEQGNKAEAKVMLTELAASSTDAALLAKSFLGKNY